MACYVGFRSRQKNDRTLHEWQQHRERAVRELLRTANYDAHATKMHPQLTVNFPNYVAHMQSQFCKSDVTSQPFHAFLSFTTTDKQLADELSIQLKSKNANLMLLDHAVTDRYDENWKIACAEKIDRAEVLICLVGTTTYQSKAVAWEIDHGLSRGKHILACNLTKLPVHSPAVLVRHAIKPTTRDVLGMKLATLVENGTMDTMHV